MFLKKQTVVKNGKTYIYYRIVSAYRDERGRAKHRIERHLGALTDEEAARIRAELRAHPGAPAPADRPRPQRPAIAAVTARAGGHPSAPAAAFVFRGMHRVAYAPRSPKEWNLAHDDMILFVREGRGELQMNGRSCALRAGAAYYCPAGSGMFVDNPHDRTLLLERVAFAAILPLDAPVDDPGGDGAAAARYERAGGPHWAEGQIPLAAPVRIGQLLDELRDAAAAGTDGAPLRTQLAFSQLLASLFKPQPAARPAQAEPGGWIAAAVRYIHDHYEDSLTRSRLALQIGMSPEHFSRLFRREVGLSFVDYLCKVRIMRSQELLQLAPSKQIGEIAKLSGFPSEPYFSRKFKQSTTYTPSAYRSKPKRYAALSVHLTSCLLTLGIVPCLGMIEPWMRTAYGSGSDLRAMKVLGGLEIGAVPELPEEAPDLILAGADGNRLEALRQLGPCCPIPDSDSDWRTPFFLLAEAVGRRGAAGAWADGFDAKAAAFKERLAPLRGRNETVVIFKIVSDRLYVYGRATSMGGLVLYDSLGLEPPAAVRRELFDRRLPNREIAPQELPLYAADHIFLFDYRTRWQPRERVWMTSEPWLSLEAVRRGRVYTPDSDPFYGYDPLSLEFQLREAAGLLLSHSD